MTAAVRITTLCTYYYSVGITLREAVKDELNKREMTLVAEVGTKTNVTTINAFPIPPVLVILKIVFATNMVMIV